MDQSHLAQAMKNYSENVAAIIDEEVNKIITDAYKRTEQILTEHVDKLHLLAETLVKLEKVNEEQFVSLMENGTLLEDKEVKEPETIEEITETVEEATETEETNE